jgi:hypothetical protein
VRTQKQERMMVTSADETNAEFQRGWDAAMQAARSFA